jgi:hypothetical protein
MHVEDRPDEDLAHRLKLYSPSAPGRRTCLGEHHIKVFVRRSRVDMVVTVTTIRRGNGAVLAASH